MEDKFTIFSAILINITEVHYSISHIAAILSALLVKKNNKYAYKKRMSCQPLLLLLKYYSIIFVQVTGFA